MWNRIVPSLRVKATFRRRLSRHLDLYLSRFWDTKIRSASYFHQRIHVNSYNRTRLVFCEPWVIQVDCLWSIMLHRFRGYFYLFGVAGLVGGGNIASSAYSRWKFNVLNVMKIMDVNAAEYKTRLEHAFRSLQTFWTSKLGSCFAYINCLSE